MPTAYAHLFLAVFLQCPLQHRVDEIDGGMALCTVDEPRGDAPARVALPAAFLQPQSIWCLTSRAPSSP